MFQLWPCNQLQTHLRATDFCPTLSHKHFRMVILLLFLKHLCQIAVFQCMSRHSQYYYYRSWQHMNCLLYVILRIMPTRLNWWFIHSGEVNRLSKFLCLCAAIYTVHQVYTVQIITLKDRKKINILWLYIILHKWRSPAKYSAEKAWIQ